MRKRFSPRRSDSNDDLDVDLGRSKSNIHSVPFYVGIGPIGVLLTLYALVYFADNNLPSPLMISDEKNYQDSFISERAIRDLRRLTDFGPRVTGSYENEVIATDFLQQEINSIIYHAHGNQKIELDLQVVSGAYNLKLLQIDQISVYSNVQNVVVKLYGKNGTENSILVNSHFDSVPTSPGGSDDGINVVAMLEILRKLSKSPEQPLHNIIFLFNGAEETPLQASHGFITKHRWASECKVLVNLEACGAGAKIILFQTGPNTPWLMKYYSMVPHPYGQAAGEEIFQTGWIPSGTDFRIFRDFGGLVGFDMAFYKNGYRYHTKYDDFQNIPLGSYQHVGDNALSLIKTLANAPELLDKNSPGKMVYFDVLGWFMISYTTFTASLINSATVILSFAIFLYSVISFKLGSSKATFRYLGLTFAAVLGSWLLAILFTLLIAFLLDLTNSTMSWYRNPWLITGLYMAPTVALSGCLLFFVNNENILLNIRCQMQAHTVRFIWTLIMLVGTILNIRSMYALLPLILLNSLAFVVIHIFRWQHTLRRWQIVYLASLIIPSVLLMYQMLVTLALFIPMTGRIGSDKNPEIIIGLMSVLFTLLITSPYVALITLLRNSKYFFACLAAVFVTFLVIVYTPLGFPYTGDINSPAPQRHWLTHTKRVFYNENGNVEKTDAGIFFLNLDRNSPGILKNYVKDLSRAKPVQEDCERYLLCGLPLSHPKMVEIMEYSTWIPANQPVIPEPLKFLLNSKELLNSTIIRYNVTASGPDRMAIYLAPKTGMKLVKTSLVDNLKESRFSYNNRQLYFILFNYGKNPANLTFTFDVEVPPNYNSSTVDLAINAIYVHDKGFVKTPYYINLLKQFPDWADLTAWLGIYSSYIL